MITPVNDVGAASASGIEKILRGAAPQQGEKPVGVRGDQTDISPEAQQEGATEGASQLQGKMQAAMAEARLMQGVQAIQAETAKGEKGDPNAARERLMQDYQGVKEKGIPISQQVEQTVMKALGIDNGQQQGGQQGEQPPQAQQGGAPEPQGGGAPGGGAPGPQAGDGPGGGEPVGGGAPLRHAGGEQPGATPPAGGAQDVPATDPVTPNGSGDDAVNLARRYLGQNSIDIRGKLPNFQAAGGQSNNCADFVSSVLQNTGRLKGHYNSVSSGQLQRGLQREGYRQVSAAQARPGDVWISPSGGHTALYSGNGRIIGSNNDRPGHQVISEKSVRGGTYYQLATPPRGASNATRSTPSPAVNHTPPVTHSAPPATHTSGGTTRSHR